MLNIFSDALKILDENTVRYMIDEMEQEIENQKTLLHEKDNVILQNTTEIQRLKSILDSQGIKY